MGEPFSLGAGAWCQNCLQPFGRLDYDNVETGYYMDCGHVACISCLSHDETHCPLCGTPFDGHTLSSLLRITQDFESSQPFGNPVEDEEVMAKRLETAILSVNDTMGLNHLRSLHLKVRHFLDSQPRNKFVGLDGNFRLLEYLLRSKEALVAQARYVNSLTETITQLVAEKTELRRRLLNVDEWYHHVTENADLKLMLDDAMECRAELNRLQALMHQLYPQTETPTPPEIHVDDHASRSATPTDSSFGPFDYNTLENREATTPGSQLSPLLIEETVLMNSLTSLRSQSFTDIGIRSLTIPSTSTLTRGSPPPQRHSNSSGDKDIDDSPKSSSPAKHSFQAFGIEVLRENDVDALHEEQDGALATSPARTEFSDDSFMTRSISSLSLLNTPIHKSDPGSSGERQYADSTHLDEILSGTSAPRNTKDQSRPEPDSVLASISNPSSSLLFASSSGYQEASHPVELISPTASTSSSSSPSKVTETNLTGAYPATQSSTRRLMVTPPTIIVSEDTTQNTEQIPTRVGGPRGRGTASTRKAIITPKSRSQASDKFRLEVGSSVESLLPLSPARKTSPSLSSEMSSSNSPSPYQIDLSGLFAQTTTVSVIPSSNVIQNAMLDLERLANQNLADAEVGTASRAAATVNAPGVHKLERQESTVDLLELNIRQGDSDDGKGDVIAPKVSLGTVSILLEEKAVREGRFRNGTLPKRTKSS